MTLSKEEIKAALEREKKEREQLQAKSSTKKQGFVLYGYHIVAALFIVLSLAIVMLLSMYEPKESNPQDDSRRAWERTKQMERDFFEMDGKKGYVDRVIDSNE
ncbi:hypothetical protein SD71_16290 [Cohnella kolymensis]|uniref:Uncharacterized protein n=1 Tax=Cohnella kolymensis TaxID=1590652 RepID=A0ABR5A2F7_9BACL|nr:hypothetical protein [Cohnella kolymensis]KIL35181.1 hypothetical protein SD71_16290 [Cohnella kolymensis]